MSELIQAYWWLFLIALLIALATGYWAWARHRADQSQVTEAPNVASDTLPAPVGNAGEGASTSGNGAVTGEGTSKPKIAAAIGDPDNLLQIKGIGPKLSALCQGLGVTRFDQIAAWGPADIAEVDQHLGTFRGRIERDGWVEQARLLAVGDVAAFETKFGKLDSENK